MLGEPMPSGGASSDRAANYHPNRPSGEAADQHAASGSTALLNCVPAIMRRSLELAFGVHV